MPFNPSNPRPDPFSLLMGFWKPLAAELLGNAKTIQADDVRNNLELIATFILDF